MANFAAVGSIDWRRASSGGNEMCTDQTEGVRSEVTVDDGGGRMGGVC